MALTVWMLGLVKRWRDDTGKYVWIMCSRIGGERVEQPAVSVDFFTKYSDSALGLDVGPDHARVDDTGLHVRILCIRIGCLGVMVWMVVLSTRGSTTQAGVLHGLGFNLYHYAPFASDLIGWSTLKCSDQNYFQFGGPFAPFQEWMSACLL